MKTSAAVFSAVTLGIVAGCALVIDLGDEVKLGALDAGAIEPVVDARPSVPEAATEAGPVPGRCGLDDSPNAACAECFATTECCEINRTCAADPDCVAGLECIKDCLVNSSCIEACQTKHPGIRAVADCTIARCIQCTPPSACVKLGQCIFGLPPSAVVRKVYRNVILELDSKKCTDSRIQIVENGESDAGACY